MSSTFNISKKAIDIASKNINIKDFLLRTINYKNNCSINKFIEQLSTIDTISDVDTLSYFIKESMPSNKMIAFRCAGGESLLYGHINAIYDYAGLVMKKPTALPNMDHGINFGEPLSSFDFLQKQVNCVCQGENRKEQIHNVSPLTPVFSVGPYIHYAQNYYADDVTKKVKQQLGKTLLIFPTHTYEFSTVEYDMKGFVSNIIKKHGKEYDNILVNSYWLDLNSPLCDMFKSHGAKIVSAGARFDFNFLKRLKTIISLSDAVIGNDIGTYIGYCMHQDKPVKLVAAHIQREDICIFSPQENGNYNYNYEQFYQVFTSDHAAHQQLLFERFWGGKHLIKAPEEIKGIINLAETLLKYSHGSIKKYPECVMRLHKELSKSDNENDAVNFRLLNDSIRV